MIIACPSCSTRFKIDAARIPSKGAKVRCAHCSHVWVQRPEQEPEPEVELEILAAEPMAPHEPPEPTEPRAAEPAPRVEEPAWPVERTRDRIPALGYAQSSPAAAQESRGGFGRFALRVGWGLLLALVVLGLGAGYFLRLEIVRAWPKTNALYGLLGIDVNVVGIDFRNVTAARGIENGAVVLQLEGEIVNASGHRVAVPALQGAIRDAQGRELTQWTFEAFADSLGPKEVSAFASPHVAVPAGAEDLQLRFATAK